MTIYEKERVALSWIEAAVADASAPVVFSSFGKDSLVLIHLTSRVAPQIPVAYFELGAAPEKHAFPNRIAPAFGNRLSVLRPRRTVAVSHEGMTDLGYEITLSTGDVITILGATFREGAASEMLCAVEDSVLQTGGPEYPWDVVICGRKCSDVDVTVGSLEWDANEVRLPSWSTTSSDTTYPVTGWPNSRTSGRIRITSSAALAARPFHEAQ
jgi:hypothetical protein